ncbi:hypothetical protein BaRGS_00032314 [Batillaria attramentaria]|uniref:Uncharacterized protein n=1 Tax=Batillaria attramentaria TaxID=370345 RepID=A0ABD0JN70_9CAEN
MLPYTPSKTTNAAERYSFHPREPGEDDTKVMQCSGDLKHKRVRAEAAAVAFHDHLAGNSCPRFCLPANRVLLQIVPMLCEVTSPRTFVLYLSC